MFAQLECQDGWVYKFGICSSQEANAEPVIAAFPKKSQTIRYPFDIESGKMVILTAPPARVSQFGFMYGMDTITAIRTYAKMVCNQPEAKWLLLKVSESGAYAQILDGSTESATCIAKDYLAILEGMDAFLSLSTELSTELPTEIMDSIVTLFCNQSCIDIANKLGL